MSLQPQKIAVIGSGISGLASAYFLQRNHQVTLFEAGSYFGGHSNTVDIEVGGVNLSVDTGFLVFNRKTYPNLIALFDELGVESYDTDMSFGVSINGGQLEWAGTNLDTVFAQRSNLLKPSFLLMLRDILRFNRDAERNLHEAVVSKLSLGDLLKKGGYDQRFQDHYLVPMAAAIWSSSPRDILDFPASTFLRFCLNHALLQVNDRPTWKTVKNGSRCYVKKIIDMLKDARLNTAVTAVKRVENQVEVHTVRGVELFDQVVFATHAPTSKAIIQDASEQEQAVLSQFRYQANRAVLHTDISLLPRNKKVWSAWNYLGESQPSDTQDQAVCVSYLLNQLQRLDTDQAVIVTLNPSHEPQPETILRSFEYEHPIFDQAAIDGQEALHTIQGKNRLWFAGAWSGYGFHEDGLKSALRVVREFQLHPAWTTLP